MINDFLSSDLLAALATLIVGGVAIYLYIRQKRDYKRDAANILLMEIRSAEKLISSAKQGTPLSADTPLLPTNNWVKNNYLFIKNLDRDELDLINNFYNQCGIIDKSLYQLSIANQLEQKSNWIQGKLVDMAFDSIHNISLVLGGTDLDSVRSQYNIQRNNFLNIISHEGYVFSPDNPREELNKALNNIQMITTSSVGSKLKKIAIISL